MHGILVRFLWRCCMSATKRCSTLMRIYTIKGNLRRPLIAASKIVSRRRDRTRKYGLARLIPSLLNRRPDQGFGSRVALARFVRGHRRVSLLGSVEDERAICSEPIKKSPGRGRGF